MVVSEAMACALPVIVSREAGASELIKHGVNGLLLADATVSELAQRMDSLERDRPWAAKLGCAARKSVESLTWDTVAHQTMGVYQELLGS
jgi:glycosyltransferase involved in cell wall biosynthesis